MIIREKRERERKIQCVMTDDDRTIQTFDQFCPRNSHHLPENMTKKEEEEDEEDKNYRIIKTVKDTNYIII